MPECFVPAQILLPAETVPLGEWGVIAVDQFTSQPEYWEKAAALAEDRPSTLHIVLPEVYLDAPDVDDRVEAIHRTMADYRKNVLTRRVNGFVYVERVQQDGTVRQGLVGAVDLEAYSYVPGEKPAVRPSENTVVSRIPPRLKVRRGALLETPHVMMLADDEEQSLIEPVARWKDAGALRPLYSGQLMLDGGQASGWAVEDPAQLAEIRAALDGLGDAARFDKRWPAAGGQPPMVLAVGDGNHSLATAKAYWEELKPTLAPEEQKTHPARWCLAEVCNIHSPAIEIEPIHRVLFGTSSAAVLLSLASFSRENGVTLTPGSREGQCVRMVTHVGEVELSFVGSAAPLTVGTVENFIAYFLRDHTECRVDYIHGEDACRQMAQKGAVALLLPPMEKADLFKGVVMGGVLPRKTFSMGHAEEKRYYIECRAIAGQ